MRKQIDASAARLMPGRFTRLTVDPERMPDLYRAADVFMHLSRDEAFGNVYLEAMACGLPIVAHDSSRTRWIVGDDEYLLDAESPAEIARRIEAAFNARRPIDGGCPEKAMKFAWHRIGSQYRDFLRRVVESPAPAP
jgi:glycosyltransferase involved in cell wall biosynthesis